MKTVSNSTATLINSGPLQLQATWDLAYIALEEATQEAAQPRLQTLSRETPVGSPLQSPQPGMPQTHKQAHQLERALQRELLYRYMLRYWRVLHVTLALLTLGLTAYHIFYALQMLLPMWLRM
jgi:hypothetical protein